MNNALSDAIDEQRRMLQEALADAEARGFTAGFNEARDRAVKLAQREVVMALDGVDKHIAARKSSTFQEGKVCAATYIAEALSALAPDLPPSKGEKP